MNLQNAHRFSVEFILRKRKCNIVEPRYWSTSMVGSPRNWCYFMYQFFSKEYDIPI